MTRSEFMAAIVGGAVAVKAVASTEADGSAPKTKRLLVIEMDSFLSPEEHEHCKGYLKSYEDRYGVEFLILDHGMRIVDPNGPAETLTLRKEKWNSHKFEDVTTLDGGPMAWLGQSEASL